MIFKKGDNVMNISRYITTGIMIVIAFFIINELSVWNGEVFEGNYCSTTMYLQPKQSDEVMRKDIETAADKHDVAVFVVNREQDDAYTTRIDIYGTAQAKQEIQAVSQLKEGVLDSIFLGEHIVSYHSFDSLKDMGSQHEYYLIGNREAMDDFKADLINDYAGNFPRGPVYSTSNLYTVMIIWAVVFAFAVIMTAFRAASLKKEYALRRILGDDMAAEARVNIIRDITVFPCMYFFIRMIMSSFIDADYYSKVSICFFIAWNIVNAMIYLLLFRFDYKRDLATKHSEKNVLLISYAYKTVVMVIMIVTASLCLALINSGVELYQQKSFFEKNRDFYFVSVRGEDVDLADRISKEIYEKYDRDGKAVQIADIGGLSNRADSNVVVNAGAKEYLEEQIPELKDSINKNAMYLITPHDYSSQHRSDMEMLIRRFTDKEFDIVYLQYQSDSSIIAFQAEVESEYKSGFVKNPYIIFNNTDLVLQDGYLDNGTMYRMTTAEAEKLNKAEELVVTNVYSSYERAWMKEKKGLIAGLVFLTMILTIEGIINRIMIRYEYRVNAREIIIKKINGYSLYGRYRRILNTVFVSSGIATVLSAVMGFFFFKSSMAHIVVGSFAIVAIEVVLLYRYAVKFERISIQKILKGGNL